MKNNCPCCNYPDCGHGHEKGMSKAKKEVDDYYDKCSYGESESTSLDANVQSTSYPTTEFPIEYEHDVGYDTNSGFKITCLMSFIDNHPGIHKVKMSW